ncbi:MAG: hypothetical protein A2669_02695 [Candidatus Yanofskybacteria bacterium RIFCSPHIGHO2_01_FULL_48_25b]|uniref:Phosphatidic acid phosphatase type 2/haloperoxidase domain-containing protein n=2 Tax=Candidatus Yanofskyibacteriota TaxID=1752733 RepID=A0A1F8F0M9_9BACT|nr:MAG: hypothetical protein A2669_02695 [Candidatus Yanofskybacteria bacterium RIFCSPHIGHO2_01_FULL_48_25b]
MNTEIFFWIFNLRSGFPSWLDVFLIQLAQYLNIILVLWLVCLAYLNQSKWRNTAVMAVAFAFISRYAVTALFKWLYFHPRPPEVLGIYPWVIESGNSFPSGHTIFAFTLATIVYKKNRKLGAVFYILGAIIGFARIFVGVHWPSDVLGGAILGILVGLLANWLYKKIRDPDSWLVELAG